MCGFCARSRQDQYLLSDAESKVLSLWMLLSQSPHSWGMLPGRFWALGRCEHPPAETWTLWAPFWKHKPYHHHPSSPEQLRDSSGFVTGHCSQITEAQPPLERL